MCPCISNHWVDQGDQCSRSSNAVFKDNVYEKPLGTAAGVKGVKPTTLDPIYGFDIYRIKDGRKHMAELMREDELKALTLTGLRAKRLLRAGDTLASEYVFSAKSRRADLAVMSKEFIGVEIKSEYDSLARLQGQLAAYTKTFDRVVLVVADRHLKSALELAPPCVEIWSPHWSGKCQVVKAGTTTYAGLEGKLAQLTVDALRRLAGSGDFRSRNALTAAAKLASNERIVAELRTFFNQRYFTTSSMFWRECKGRPIRPEHVSLLSIYSDARKVQELALIQEKTVWAKWARFLAMELSGDVRAADV